MVASHFRVIIIGAGPTGLYLAHALHAANIDFIILERAPPTFFERGNHLLIWSHTARLLDQIGLYDEAKRRAYKLASKRDMLSDGHTMSNYPIWQDTRRLSLHDCNEAIRTSSEVTRIEEVEDGVHVHLADASIISGSVLVGADGTHCVTRTYIRKQALKQGLGPFDACLPEISTTSHYMSIYAEGANRLGIERRVFFETRATSKAIHMGTNGDLLRLVLYKKLPEPTSGRVVYTPEQMEDVAESLFDKAAAPGIKLRDIWPDVNKVSARLVSQDEGFAERWFIDRVVPTGDAAVTCLTSSEQFVSSSGNPSAKLLREAFSRHQCFRAKELKRIWQFGYYNLRQMTWNSWTDWFIDRVVRPWVPMTTFMNAYVILMVRNGQILTYIPFMTEEAPVSWRWNPDSA
ncbi:FAD/NAD(P)-binding domain-containing protein [Xylariaceae sp. FL1272]|nr:FAD/NAD(P)-binding domain-containing protein [Xylariaceae sp. FL1272]